MERKCMLVTRTPEYDSLEEIAEFERGSYGIIDGVVWHMGMLIASTLNDLLAQVPIQIFRRCTHLVWVWFERGQIAEFCGSPLPYRVVDDKIEFLEAEIARQVADLFIDD